jgi:membrane protein
MLGGAMSESPPPAAIAAADAPTRRRGLRRVTGRTLGKAWEDDIFSHSAQAAFWQTLSLPPLFLGLLGLLGYVGDRLGPSIVEDIERGIVDIAGRVFAPEVVDQIIEPTATSILTTGRADIVSIGFLIALFAGSSATASLVDSITHAHRQKLVRHPVWQRIFSLILYLFGLVVAVVTLPIVALGPDLLGRVLPVAWQPTAASFISSFYYPGTALVLVLALTTLYKLALPHSLPWWRLLPGALLAMLVFLASATGLRYYILLVTSTGYTYGALATPIAFLLVAFLLGFAIILGAEVNNAVEEVWPSRPTRRQRRLKRLLSMRRIAARAASAGAAAAGAAAARAASASAAAARVASARVGPPAPRDPPPVEARLPRNGTSARTATGPPQAAEATERA